MQEIKFYSTSQTAEILGISRIAVFKKIKKGQIKAGRVGKNYLIPVSELPFLEGRALVSQEKHLIDKAVHKTFKEYGRALELLGKE